MRCFEANILCQGVAYLPTEHKFGSAPPNQAFAQKQFVSLINQYSLKRNNLGNTFASILN
jgi:hypothetical protein